MTYGSVRRLQWSDDPAINGSRFFSDAVIVLMQEAKASKSFFSYVALNGVSQQPYTGVQ